MEPPPFLGPHTADQTWITHGPDSGGIAGWLLWQGHLFAFEHEGHTSRTAPGLAAADFLRRYGDTDDEALRPIVAALREGAA